MSKVLIGLTTYGPLPRAQRAIESIWTTTSKDITFEIAIADDSAGGGYNISARRDFCKRKNIHLLEGETITGIPASWNRLVRKAKELSCDIVVIVSDGVRFMVPGWLERMVHFLERNEQVGTVGTPTVGEPSFDPTESRWGGSPGRVGCAVGCSFSFKTEVHSLIENPDGTIGFWEDLLGFHEELDFGFSLSEKGLLSYMLPWPPSYYRGGMAFGAHHELMWRKVSDYLPLEEFLKYVRISPWYVPPYEEMYAKGQVDKMSYSRIMLAKKWGLLEQHEKEGPTQEIKGESVLILAEPQKPIHVRTVDIWEPRIVKYLDREGNEQECVTS